MTSKAESLKSYQIFISGVSGVLGRRITPVLVSLGAHIMGVDIRQPPGLFNRFSPEQVKFVKGEFPECIESLPLKAMGRRFSKRVLIHLAGMANARDCTLDPKRAYRLNVEMVERSLKFCEKNYINKFIFPSTAYIYGAELKRPAKETDLCFPGEVYSRTKMAAEQLIQKFAGRRGLTCIIARLSNVYGSESSKDTVLGSVLHQIRGGKQIVLQDLGPIRDFIHIDDVVAGLVKLVRTDVKSGCELVNLSTGVGTSIKQLCKYACDVVGWDESRVQEKGTNKLGASFLVLENHKLKELTGWTPQISLKDGLVDMLTTLIG